MAFFVVWCFWGCAGDWVVSAAPHTIISGYQARASTKKWVDSLCRWVSGFCMCGLEWSGGGGVAWGESELSEWWKRETMCTSFAWGRARTTVVVLVTCPLTARCSPPSHAWYVVVSPVRARESGRMRSARIACTSSVYFMAHHQKVLVPTDYLNGVNMRRAWQVCVGGVPCTRLVSVLLVRRQVWAENACRAKCESLCSESARKSTTCVASTATVVVGPQSSLYL